MGESVFLPAANWYFSQCFSISNDCWMVYGSGKCIAVCNLLDNNVLNSKSLTYDSKLISNAHTARVSNIVLMSTWNTSKLFVSAAGDGMVKLWSADSLLSKKAHNNHQSMKEEVMGVSCAKDGTVISIGSLSRLVIWNIEDNTCKISKVLPPNFKASTLNCCPYKDFLAAVGSKSGLIFLISWKDSGHVLCKLKSHETAIKSLEWSMVSKHEKKQCDLNSQQLIDTSVVINKSLNNGSMFDSVLTTEDSLESQALECSIEDDTFNIYEDFEADEFGHKKYQPEDIIVKTLKDNEKINFLDECKALKNDILCLKEDKPLQETISFNNSGLANKSTDFQNCSNDLPESIEERLSKVNISEDELSENIFLAVVDETGKSSIWSDSGKFLCLSGCPSIEKKKSRYAWAMLLWVSPECLVLADHTGQIFSTNPTKITGRKMKWTSLHHYHKKAVFSLASFEIVSSVNSKKSVILVSSSQDRKILFYSLTDKKIIKETVCISGCPTRAAYSNMDPLKLAIGCGDGSIVCWDFEVPSDENAGWGNCSMFWHGVQNRVLSVCWHPFKENVLAFSTFDGKVGLMNTSNASFSSVVQLHPAFTKAVYDLSWGPEELLYACGNNSLKVYKTIHPHKEPDLIEVEYEGNVMKIITFHLCDEYIIIGSPAGSVAVVTLAKPHNVEAIIYVSNKEIYFMQRHPKAVTSEDGVSPYADWFAVGAAENSFTVVKVNFEDKIGIDTICTLQAHSNSINRLAWSPHHNARILSVSSDLTVHVWDVLSSSVISTFTGHNDFVLLGMWCPLPEYSDLILSGGLDMTIKVWDTRKHPPNMNVCIKTNQRRKLKLATHVTEEKSSRLKDKEVDNIKESEEHESKILNNQTNVDNDVQIAHSSKNSSRKTFMTVTKHQQGRDTIEGCKRLLKKHIMSQTDFDISKCDELDINENEPGLDYLKLFGNRDDVLELMKLEQNTHLEFNRIDDYIIISLLKGEVDEVLKFAKEKEKLNFFLLALAPSVSHRFWKELMTGLSDGDFGNITRTSFGGVHVQKSLTKLAVQDVEGAVKNLIAIKMFKEAIALARIRYLDELADSALLSWAKNSALAGLKIRSAEIYLSLGKLNEALGQLRKLESDEYLEFMYHLAKCAGSEGLAESFHNKIALIKQPGSLSSDEDNLLAKPDVTTVSETK